jgi:hypothetical protein
VTIAAPDPYTAAGQNDDADDKERAFGFVHGGKFGPGAGWSH